MNIKVSISGDYRKSGLTKKQLRETIEAVFFEVSLPLSSRAKRSEVEGSISEVRSPKSENNNKGFLRSPRCLSECGRNDKKINIAFVDSKEIQKLNREYRKKDKSTDVLSFDYDSEGDILLCVDLINKMKDDSESLFEAVQKTLIHGTLHLFGYNHEKEEERAIMEVAENKIYLQIRLE